MDASPREELERELRRRMEEGDLEGAAAAAVRGYGREIFSFLAAIHRDEQDAADVFSLFAEGLWRGLVRFEWQCSFRTWAYEVARRSSLRYRRDARRRAAKFVPLPEGSMLSRVEQEVRAETLTYLRTERRNRIAELRASLPEDDQVLLLLRVDRQLAWNDLAAVMCGDEAEPLRGEALKREAARLRKRFQLVKERLQEMGRREGLLPSKQGAD